jgi:hypothetical protein
MTMLVLLAAAAMAGASPDPGSRCPVAPGNPVASDHAINTKGTGVAGRAAGTELAIKTKGTGAQRTASTELAIKTKGTGAQRTASTELAIKTKGTGAQRSSAAGGAAAATDCNDTSAK